jgi:pimeloyl-ACP methyl ester carboxylesterase
MARQLVFVHGRSQQHKNASDLKAAWISAWETGLKKSGLALPIAEEDIRFPYYGDTLDALVREVPAGEVPDVLIRGEGGEDDEKEFLAAVVLEAQRGLGITEEQVQAAAPEAEPFERGPQNWRWVRAILKAIDSSVPGGSGAGLALATYDVYQYLRNPGIRDMIEEGVRAAISADHETVVVGHSLGSVVSYNLLKREGDALDWRVPLYVTVGCPLAISAIRRALMPIGHPPCAPTWFNALDKRDVVALYPLDAGHFNVDPAVENKTDVRNDTSNRHGISGYLGDAEVAQRIYSAVVA